MSSNVDTFAPSASTTSPAIDAVKAFVKMVNDEFGGSLPVNITDHQRAFLAHMAWLIEKRADKKVATIMANPVFKLICLKLGWSEEVQLSFITKLSLEPFYGVCDFSLLKDYAMYYHTVFFLFCDPNVSLTEENPFYNFHYRLVFSGCVELSQLNRVLLSKQLIGDFQRCNAMVAMLA
jgi:hypothetical protein